MSLGPIIVFCQAVLLTTVVTMKCNACHCNLTFALAPSLFVAKQCWRCRLLTRVATATYHRQPAAYNAWNGIGDGEKLSPESRLLGPIACLCCCQGVVKMSICCQPELPFMQPLLLIKVTLYYMGARANCLHFFLVLQFCTFLILRIKVLCSLTRMLLL